VARGHSPASRKFQRKQPAPNVVEARDARIAQVNTTLKQAFDKAFGRTA